MTQVLVQSPLVRDGVSYAAGSVVSFSRTIAVVLAGVTLDPKLIAIALSRGAPLFDHETQLRDLGRQEGVVDVFTAGGSYTLAVRDLGRHHRVDSASPAIVTVPGDDVPFPVNSVITIEQASAGPVTIAGATGVTINRMSGLSAVMAGRYAVVQLIKVSPNVWTLFGALAAA